MVKKAAQFTPTAQPPVVVLTTSGERYAGRRGRLRHHYPTINGLRCYSKATLSTCIEARRARNPSMSQVCHQLQMPTISGFAWSRNYGAGSYGNPFRPPKATCYRSTRTWPTEESISPLSSWDLLLMITWRARPARCGVLRRANGTQCRLGQAQTGSQFGEAAPRAPR